MALFVNTGMHPDLFKNKSTLKEPNQGYFKVDYFAEMIKEQKKINDSLLHSYNALQRLHHKQDQRQSSQWMEIGNKLNELKNSSLKRDQFEGETIMWLRSLDDKNEELQDDLANRKIINEDLNKQMITVSESNETIINKLKQHGLVYKEITSQIDELKDMQIGLSNQMAEQADEQGHVLHRLEDQEALLQKMSRQITHFRSILYERTNFLAEKVEESYQLTASYIYKLLTGSEQPLTLFMMKQKTKENEEKSE